MRKNNIFFLKLKLVFTSIVFFHIVYLILNLIFFYDYSYDYINYYISFLILTFTLYSIYYFSYKWINIDNKNFLINLFFISLIFGIIYSIFYLNYFYYNFNDYFEFNAQDSKVYFDNSLIILNNFKNDNNIYQGLIPFIKIEDL